MAGVARAPREGYNSARSGGLHVVDGPAACSGAEPSRAPTRSRPGDSPMRDPIVRTLCAVLVGLQLFVWCTSPLADEPTPAAEPSAADLKATADRLDAWFQGLEQDTKELPRDSFDPKAIVDRVGSDPQKLYEWVRDQTTLVAYRGTLRGPSGVLMDRVGNSLDRALLLCELLRLAGLEVQLAHGTLSAEQAAELNRKAGQP